MNRYIYLFGNISLLLCIAILIIISLTISDWISQSSAWQGSLLSTSNSYYKDAPCNTNSPQCSSYSNLWQSGLILLSFDVLSLLSLALLAYSIFRLINRSKISLYTIFVLEILSFLFHFIGYLSWALMTKVNFRNDCEIGFEESSEATVCGRSGAILSLVVLVLMPVQCCCMVFAIRVYENDKKKGNLKHSQEINIYDSQRV